MSDTVVDSKNAALRLLARREHSRHELLQKLTRRYGAAEVQVALDQLEEDGYLSEQRFTASFLRMRVAQGHGLIRIRFDLKQKGVSPEVLEQVLNEASVDWYAQALEVVRRRFRGVVSADYKEQARRTRYLMQRGFSMDEARHAVQQFTREEDA